MALCKRKDCGETVNPATWPGDEGYCSAICRALDMAESESEQYARTLRSVEFARAALGLRRP